MIFFKFLVKASPVLIPSRNSQPIHMRPMRNSVEGLNQEIEKLVLHPSVGTLHSCRQELELVSIIFFFLSAKIDTETSNLFNSSLVEHLMVIVHPSQTFFIQLGNILVPLIHKHLLLT